MMHPIDAATRILPVAGLAALLGVTLATTGCPSDGNAEARPGGVVAMTAEAESETPPAGATTVVLILDTSGSMAEAVGGSSKIDIAKDVLVNEFLPLLSDEAYVGLYVFDDDDGRLLVPVRKTTTTVREGWLQREVAMAGVDEVSVGGGTPIVSSLDLVRGDIEGYPGDRVVILITDGEESYYTETDVKKRIDYNTEAKIDTFVIGYELGEEGRYLERKLGLDKRYFQANGGRDGLLRALESVLEAIEK